MDQNERRIWLIKELLKEDQEYKGIVIPDSVQEQKDLLRSLMNVRMPKVISSQFLSVQDAYLQQENQEAGITDVNDLSPLQIDQRLYLWQGDMSSLKIEAVVNPANSALLGCFRPMHNCLDNILHSKAGIQMRLACDRLMKEQGHEEETGRAKITSAYNLPSQYVIHTVGPIVQGRLTKRHEELLASCYRSCLQLAQEKGIKEIAFCCISTGVFMFPPQRAAEIAVKTVTDYLREHDHFEKIVFNVYLDSDRRIYQKLLG